MQTVYAVSVNADETEGRGPMLIRFLATNKETAEKIAKANEPYGNYPQLTSVEPMYIYTDMAQYEAGKTEKVRMAALRKLTDVEKKVLGLSD